MHQTPTYQNDPAIFFTRMSVHTHEVDKDSKTPGEHLLYEGEAQFLDTNQLDAYKGLIGDGKGRVTVSKELSESDFGRGGKTMVSVSLTCDQSHGAINAAVNMADQLATYWADNHHTNLRSYLYQKGILKT